MTKPPPRATGHTSPNRTRRGDARTVALIACLAQVLIVLDTTIVAVALPDAQPDLGFAMEDRQWAVTSYTLTFGSLLVLGGRFSQVLGGRRAFLIGIAGFGAACILGGLANSYALFLLSRVLQGVFAALLAPTNLALISTAFPDSAGRAKAFALFGSVAGAGAALGLILGGILTDVANWRWCFFISGPLAAMTFLAAWCGLARTARLDRSGLWNDVLGLACGSATVFLAIAGFTLAERESWDHPGTLAALTGSALMAAAFIARERMTAGPAVPLSLFADPRRSTAYLSIALVGFAQMGTSMYLTFYLQDTLGYSPLRTGLSFLPMVAGLIVAAVLATRLIVPRWGVGTAFVLGATVQAVGFLWMSGLNTEDAYRSELLGPLIVAGLGLGLVMAPAMSTSTLGVPASRTALASSLANTSQQFGASLGVALLGSIASAAVTRSMDEAATSLPIEVAEHTARNPGAITPEQAKEAAIAAALRTAEVDAYNTGLMWLALICVAIALLITTIFVLGRRHA